VSNAGREFQTVSAATGKLCRPSSVLVRGIGFYRWIVLLDPQLCR